MPPAPAHLRRTVRRLFRRLLLPVFALTLLSTMWLAVLHQLATERASTRKEAVAHSQALARVLSDHVSHILGQTDHATQLFKLKYEETHGRLRLPEFTRRGGLLESVLPAHPDLPMALYDKQGIWIDSANAIVPDDVSEMPFFTALAQAERDAPYFGTPVLDERTHKWHIKVARRLNNEAGQFDGVVVIMIDPITLVQDYDRLNLDEHDTLVLFSRDATLSVGRIGQRLIIDDKVRFGPARAFGSDAEEVEATPALDGIARVYGDSDMARFSLKSVVGVTERAAMARFAAHRDTYLTVAAGASVLIALMVLLLMRQATQLRASMRAARTAQATLRAASDASLDGLIIMQAVTDVDGVLQDFRFLDVNERGAALYRSARADLLGQLAFATLPLLRQTGFFDKYAQVLATGVPLEEEVELHLDGEAPLWLQHQIVPLKDGVAVTSRDITARKEDELRRRAAEGALRESEARLRTIADSLPAMVAYVDAQQVYRFHNLAYDEEFGRAGMAVPGRTVRDTMGEARYQFLQPYIERALAGETLVFEEQLEQHDHDGAERCQEVTYIPQRGEDGASVVGFHIMRQDVTHQHREKKRLIKLAQVDPLTGLANRAGFRARLDLAMHNAVQNERLMAVMYMDIDRFKPVNDTYGHEVGDKLLKAFSGRLTQALRASDTVARLGGDEFTIIIENLTRREDASAAAAKIVTAMRTPFELDGVTVSVSTSIGLAFFRDGAHDPDALLRQADTFLYQAKQAGRDTFRAAA
ncbi:MAG: diguanylate cyclase domain-containing protein [Gammaproteobacteria bacterium]